MESLHRTVRMNRKGVQADSQESDDGRETFRDESDQDRDGERNGGGSLALVDRADANTEEDDGKDDCNR